MRSASWGNSISTQAASLTGALGGTLEAAGEADVGGQGKVVILCPGGLEHGGGIGRQMSYFLAATRVPQRRLAYRVVDTRGPWFLGQSRLRVLASLRYFAGSMCVLLALRASGRRGLVHVNITGRGSTVRKAVLCGFARVLGLPYLLHVHDPDYLDGYLRLRRPMRAFVRTAFQRAVTVIVLGMRDRERLIAGLNLQAARVQILYNAVPDPRPVPRKPRGPAERCKILFLGYLSERKGVPELLRALASPALASRAWQATLAGGGAVDVFRHMADSLGISQRVRFPGWVGSEEVASLCSAGDILVLPSHAEGLAMSVLEGLAHAMVVVTTPVGAHPEVIEPSVSGVFVAPGDVHALVDALTRLIDDAEERARLGAAGRRRYEERFEAGRYAQALTRIHLAWLAPSLGELS